jgi:hypothetical protein
MTGRLVGKKQGRKIFEDLPGFLPGFACQDCGFLPNHFHGMAEILL